MRDDMSELKKRAMAIVDIYSDLNKITEREANILREAITTDRPQGEWVNNECPFCGRYENYPENFCATCGADLRGEKNA